MATPDNTLGRPTVAGYHCPLRSEVEAEQRKLNADHALSWTERMTRLQKKAGIV